MDESTNLDFVGVKKDFVRVYLVIESENILMPIGFGISTPEQAGSVVKLSDGAIFGSAIVKLVAKYRKGCVNYVSEYVRSMKKGIEDAVN